MKKLILTNDLFEGEVYLLYDSDKKLVLIDMKGAILTPDQTRVLKNRTPEVYIDRLALKAAFNSETLVVIEADYKITFEDDFYIPYGKKRNRHRCEDYWNNSMSEVKRMKAVAGLTKFNRYHALNSWKTKPDPENYLRKELWLDDWK